MKKYLISIHALLIIGCGIYLWANSISKKEQIELLNGEYALVDWQIRPKPAIYADSLTVYGVPQRGERLTLQTNDNGDFRLTTESSLPVLQQLVAWEWQPLYTQRTWLAWRHRVIGQYHADEQSATVYWDRVFVNQTDVGITLQLSDPIKQIDWFLILQKR
ncbi:MAG: hypothetical protein MR292_10465 [Alistipes sp.]|nr:hypothetical protein [Alistipes sp.]